MAIIVNEEKSRTNLISLLGWLGILAAVGAAVYYIFFAAPELVIIAPSGNLGAIAPIASITIHPEDVINSPAFQALQAQIPPPSATGPALIGRTNPFLP